MGDLAAPRFGQADLSNCERELIHLAGSIQPHGLLLVLHEPGLRVVQASTNAAALLGLPFERLIGAPAAALGGDLARSVAHLALDELAEPVPFACVTGAGGANRRFDGVVHRVVGAGLVVELEPECAGSGVNAEADGGLVRLQAQVAAGIERFSSASGLGTLVDAIVRVVRELTGYDRVMVYRFDPDGHGKIIAEARDPRLEPLLGHHYPASDIPQRARELYLRNRVRVLVDVGYEPAHLVPRLLPDDRELDMSMCALRSMSPLHLQYLKNMGVTATLVVSLVREGRLWGLIACHHDSARHLRPALRAACGLLAEVASTRIAAIENYAHAQVAILVRRLEQRLIEATSVEGDWRLALFRNPRTLLQPLEATGAALFEGDEVLSTGEVPSTPELRALRDWLHARDGGEVAFSSIGRENPALASLTPTACGVLAVRLADARPDYLMWFRKEQLQSVTWAGDPTKPVAVGNDPRELSPRRSFAAWSEIVRGTALPWTPAELALARAIGLALVDIILQVHAVRLLIAEHQLAGIRATVHDSKEPVVIADERGRVLLVNEAFVRLSGAPGRSYASLDDVAALFDPPGPVADCVGALRRSGRPWRGELALRQADGGTRPVSARTEAVPGRDGGLIGCLLILGDLSETKRADAARRHLEDTLARAAVAAFAGDAPVRAPDDVVNAIITNASLAAMDIADASGGPGVAPLLEEVEAATLRAATLYAQLKAFAARSRGTP